MLQVATALADPAASIVEKAEAPAGGVFESFRQLCFPQAPSADSIRRNGENAGWSPSSEDARAEVSALIKMARASVGETVKMNSLQVFAGRGDEFAIVSDLVFEGTYLVGCYVYDFSGSVPLAHEQISVWLNEQPSRHEDLKGVYRTATWLNPAAFPDAVSIRYGYFANKPEITSQIGFAGNSLAVTFEMKAKN